MQVGSQESDLILDGSGDHPDMVRDNISTVNCSVASSSQTCDNIFGSKCVSSDDAAAHGINSRYSYNDAVLPAVTCNESTSERPRSENVSGGEDCSLEALDKGGISPLVGAMAALDVCGHNRIDIGKLTSTSLKEEFELQVSGSSSLHHNQVCKIPSGSKDLRKSTDKATEEKEVCQEMKSDNACCSQLRSNNFSGTSTSVENNSCCHDAHISENSNSAVSDFVTKSPYPHAGDISLPPLDVAFPFNCSEDARVPSFFGYKNKVEAAHVSLPGGIITDQSKVNCVKLSSAQLVPPVITKFSTGKLGMMKVNVGSEGKKAECCPSERTDVSQTYTNTTGITIMSKNKVTATSSVEATETCVSFSGTVPRELHDIVSMSTSQADIPHTSAPGVATCGLFEPFLRQNMGLSNPLGVNDVLSNVSASKNSFAVDMPPKLSALPESHILKSTNKSSSTVLGSLSRDSSVFSGVHFCTLSAPISSTSISKPVVTNSHLSSISSDLEFSLRFGTSVKCGAPCTESAMDTCLSSMGTVGSTCLKPGFKQTRVNVYSKTKNTSQQNSGCFNTKIGSLNTAASAFISCGTVSSCAATIQSSLSLSNSSVLSINQLEHVSRIENTTTADFSTLGSILTTETSVSSPNTSVVSTGHFRQVSRIDTTTCAVPSTNVTAGLSGFWYSKKTSSLEEGTGFSRFRHCSSKPVFGCDLNSSKYESVEDTSVRKDMLGSVFQVNSPGNQSPAEKASKGTTLNNGSSTLFTVGPTEMKHDNAKTFHKDFMWEPNTAVASNNFNEDIISNRFTFGIPSPATSSGVLFSFSGSDRTSKYNSKLHLRGRLKFHLHRRSNNSAQTTSPCKFIHSGFV
jgi:hypothetical protein